MSALKLRDYQKEGTNFLLRKKRAILADDMGLGKTVQVIKALELGMLKRCLIVCPSSLKFVWQEEFEKWLPSWKVQVVRDGKTELDDTADAIIINYDLLTRKRVELLNLGNRAIVFDEAHYMKNPKAKRTRVCIELAWKCSHRFLLTGTPIINKPIELVSLLKCMGRLTEFGGWHTFVQKYCSPRIMRRGGRQIKIYDGAANLGDLREKLHTNCMIRRTKLEVLKELPRTQRIMVPVEIENRREYDRCEKDLQSWLMQNALSAEDPDDIEKWRNSVAVIGMNATAETLAKITYLKQVAARGKIRQGVEWIQDYLESTDEKLVVFGHHREVIDELHRAFPSAAVIRGGDSDPQRKEAVHRFQNDSMCRLFIGSIKAAGVGLTLTAASTVMFMELAWSPSDINQAIDRVNRIGQESDSVKAYFIVGKNTIEGHVLSTLRKKTGIISEAIGS